MPFVKSPKKLRQKHHAKLAKSDLPLFRKVKGSSGGVSLYEYECTNENECCGLLLRMHDLSVSVRTQTSINNCSSHVYANVLSRKTSYCLPVSLQSTSRINILKRLTSSISVTLLLAMCLIATFKPSFRLCPAYTVPKPPLPSTCKRNVNGGHIQLMSWII